jgi:hypothetical protein
VYLITDSGTGALYVGAAYGSEGVWGRWRGYAARGGWHNGNEGLFELFERDGEYARHFRFSLLHVMSRSTPKTDVVALEALWKERLGSRAITLGYNRD